MDPLCDVRQRPVWLARLIRSTCLMLAVSSVAIPGSAMGDTPERSSSYSTRAPADDQYASPTSTQPAAQPGASVSPGSGATSPNSPGVQTSPKKPSAGGVKGDDGSGGSNPGGGVKDDDASGSKPDGDNGAANVLPVEASNGPTVVGADGGGSGSGSGSLPYTGGPVGAILAIGLLLVALGAGIRFAERRLPAR